MDLAAARRLVTAAGPTWAMMPDHVETMVSALAAGARAVRQSPSAAVPGDVAVVPIVGALTPRPNFMSVFFGASTYAGITASVREAAATASVARIALFTDSPGGTAQGCEECADEIWRAGKIKPIFTFNGGLMGSAALWLGSQAGQIYAGSSALSGSVGVYGLHFDLSRALDEAGITASFVVARVSPHKVDGNPFEPLSPDARKWEQGQVDEIASRFVRAVARGRSVSADVVRRDFGQGRVFLAADAKRAGMIDEIVPSFEAALARAPASVAAARAQRLAHLSSPTPREAEVLTRRARLAELTEEPT